MSSLTFLLCVQTALIQIIAGQFLGNALNNNMLAPGLAPEAMGWAGPGFGCGAPFGAPYGPGPMIAPEFAPLGPATLPSSNGGGFMVSSISPIAPMGVSVISDNEYTGPLAVGGQLPFLGTVELEGALATAGSGAVSYGCGNGNVGMVSEDILPTPEMAYANGFGPGFGPGFGSGFGPGYGYGPGFPGPNYGLGPAGLGLNGLNRCEAI